MKQRFPYGLAVFMLFFIGLNHITVLASDENMQRPLNNRVAALSGLPPVQGGVMILGDSLTASQEFSDLFNTPIHNRGVSGFTTGAVIDNFNSLFRGVPDKVFILLGINDIILSKDNRLLENYRQIIKKIKNASPESKIYVISILPTMSDKLNAAVLKFNNMLLDTTSKEQLTYIDLHQHLLKGQYIDPKYVTDGLHLSGEGYLVMRDVLAQFVK
jgi:lysophospholipase L1-like esterase